MLVTLIPLFDENMKVKAYSMFTQRDHYFSNHKALPEECNLTDQIEGLDVIRSMGAETLVGDKEIFVTVNSKSVLTKFEDDCPIEADRLVLIIDNTFPTDDEHVKRLVELKAQGYKLAMRKLEVNQYQRYQKVLALMNYMFFDYKKMNITSGRMFFSKVFPVIKLCAGNIETQETFEKLKKEGGYQFFEGPFYRTAITVGQHKVKPLKMNYIELLNMVNKEDYDLTKVADVVARDTALAIALLKVVNRLARNSEIVSIKHGAAMLGQRELRSWINTVVVNEMYSDKPNEITRLSLLRAKFAENIAKDFEMAHLSQELFLMGLFSVVDLILEMPMEQAMEKLQLSKEIREVLTEQKGIFSDLYRFMQAYENANWETVDEIVADKKLEPQNIYNAYTGALEWYRDLFGNKKMA
jgi:EAL and modified HD-GYP domain-containing signal transduction protein